MNRALLAVAALVVAAPRADAQVSARRGLVFDTVVTGLTTSIGPTSPKAASWRIWFTVGGFCSIQLTLPTTLARSGGGATMPVAFCPTCGLRRWGTDDPTGATVFNPASSVNLGLVVILSELFIWLGGSVSPPIAQMPGSYSGTITLTLSGLSL